MNPTVNISNPPYQSPNLNDKKGKGGNNSLYIEFIKDSVNRAPEGGIVIKICPPSALIKSTIFNEPSPTLKTLLHELTHLAQWIRGSLRFRYGKLCYSKQPVENWEYWYQPHEIEAREEEERLFEMYLMDTEGVPVPKVVQSFPNRLMQAV